MSPMDSIRIFGSAMSRSSVRRNATVSSSGSSRMSSSTDASCGMMLVFSEPWSTVGVMVVRSSAFRSGSLRIQARPSFVFSAAAASESQAFAGPGLVPRLRLEEPVHRRA